MSSSLPLPCPETAAAAATTSTAAAPAFSSTTTPQKLILITGVGRGLGRALAMELAGRGHTIAGISRTQSNLTSLITHFNSVSSQPYHHSLHTADIRSDAEISEIAKKIISTLGVPDIVINNAGTINSNAKLWDVPASDFQAVMDTNVVGTANVIHHFLPPMVERKRGVVVNFSSGWGRSAAALVAPYCASKWAVEGLTRSLAKELPPGMVVVALSPGVINTEMLRSCFGDSAGAYQSPESWAPKAADMILRLTVDDNGASLTV